MKKEISKSFEDVYTNYMWGRPDASGWSLRKNKLFYSGGGTDPRNDRNNQYIDLIQSYIDKDEVASVVEIGCGDWEVSGRINWSKVTYTGYDVVSELIAYNQKNYASENVQFVCDDIIDKNNVSADLLIIKDVIQHLPPSYCQQFVNSIKKNFRYNIITNDMSDFNKEIEFGGYSPNNFASEPFNCSYQTLISWQQVYPSAGNKVTITLV